MNLSCTPQGAGRLHVYGTCSHNRRFAVLLEDGASILSTVDGSLISWDGESVRLSEFEAHRDAGSLILTNFPNRADELIGPFSDSLSYRVHENSVGFEWTVYNGNVVPDIISAEGDIEPEAQSETRSPTSYSSEEEAHFEAWRYVAGGADDRTLLRLLRDGHFPATELMLTKLLGYLDPTPTPPGSYKKHVFELVEPEEVDS